MRLPNISIEWGSRFSKASLIDSRWAERKGKGVSKPVGKHELCGGQCIEMSYSGFPSQPIKSHHFSSRLILVKLPYVSLTTLIRSTKSENKSTR